MKTGLVSLASGGYHLSDSDHFVFAHQFPLNGFLDRFALFTEIATLNTTLLLITKICPLSIALWPPFFAIILLVTLFIQF